MPDAHHSVTAVLCTVLTGARVLQDSGRILERSLWIDGGVIRAVGPPDGGHVPTDVPRRPLAHRLVLPAFCDAHAHFQWIGELAVRPDLGGARSRRETLARLDAALAEADLPETLVAEGWDESDWVDDPRPLEREDLDRLSTDRPIVARRACTHTAVVNSAALALLPAGSDVDPPTGRLVEEAAMGVTTRLPGLDAEAPRALDAALAHAERSGVSCVHDFVRLPELRALRAWADTRARARRPAALDVDAYLRYAHFRSATAADLEPSADGSVRVAGVKFFLDGSIGARTAALERPYLDGASSGTAPSSPREPRCGQLLWSREDLARAYRTVHAAGLPCATHVIGDAAVTRALDALEDAGVRPGDRLEHVELTHPAQRERMAALGVLASMQPNFVARWAGPGGLYEIRLGPARAAATNAFASMVRAGVPLAFGSDSMPMGPAFGLTGAIAHPNPAERLTLADAVRAYTAAGRAVTGRHGGRIDDGLPADLVVVDTRSDEPAAILAAPLRATLRGGVVVHGTIGDAS